LRNGTDTTDRVYAAGLGYEENPKFDHYQPITRPWFQRMVAELLADVRHGVFIDLGSGKGRVDMLASQHRFSSVIAVEYSRILHAVTSYNLRRYAPRHLRSGRLQLVECDAGEFKFPEVNRVVILFYNPFGRAVMERVVENLQTWLDAGERSAVVLSRNAVHAAAFAEPPFHCIASHGGYCCWRAFAENEAEIG